jgi:hypothetical protein
MNKHANRRKEKNEVFDESAKAFDLVIASLQEQLQLNEELLQKKSLSFNETIKRNQKIIDDSKAPAVEQLRALIVNVFEHDDLVQLHQEKRDLLLSELLVSSIRIFKEEVSFELNRLHATICLQKPETEETEKYAKLQAQLGKIKRTIDEEYKPLMDKLRNEINKRNKFLRDNR